MITPSITCLRDGSIASAEANQRLLVEALAAAGAIEVDLSACEALDVTGLQLLAAAAAGAQGSGRSFTLAADISAAAAKALARAGLDPFRLSGIPLPGEEP